MDRLGLIFGTRKNSKHNLFRTKSRVSREELNSIKKKIDSDIKKIVDYSMRVRDEVSNSGSQHSSPSKRRTFRQHDSVKTREQIEDELKLIKSFAISKSTSENEHSSSNIINMKINSSIITQLNNLQKRSENLKILFANRLGIYEDYKKLVEFK